MAEQTSTTPSPEAPKLPFLNMTPEQKSKLEQFKTKLADVHNPERHYDEYYFRFLKARDFDLDKAELMFRNMVKWKKEFGVEDIIQNFPSHHEFQSLRAYWPAAISGLTKDGGYIFVERVGQVDPKSLFGHVSNEALLKFHVWTVESHEALRFEQFKKQGYSCPITIIQDAKGFGLRHAYRPAIDFVGKLSKMDNDNYPENMHRLFVINTPAIFGSLFGLLKPLIDPVTLSKVEILGYNYMARLTEQLPTDQLPTIIGGTKEMHFNLAGEFESDLKKDGTSVTVGAGEKHRVKFPAKAGTVFRYHFKTEGYNIGFGVLQSADASGAAKERWVIESKKFESQVEPVADTVLAEFEGEYTFEFDNSFSRWRSKDLIFKITVESTPDDAASLGNSLASPPQSPAPEESKKKKKDKTSSESPAASPATSEKVRRKKSEASGSSTSSPVSSPKTKERKDRSETDSPSGSKKKKTTITESAEESSAAVSTSTESS